MEKKTVYLPKKVHYNLPDLNNVTSPTKSLIETKKAKFFPIKKKPQLFDHNNLPRKHYLLRTIMKIQEEALKKSIPNQYDLTF